MNLAHPFACALILLGGAPMAPAQTAKPGSMWQKFYAQLATVARGGNKDTRWMVCLDVPGLPLAPLHARETADVTYADRMLDRTAEFNPVYTPGKAPVSKIYGEILQFHKADRGTPLKPGEKADFDQAVELTKPKGRIMKLYEKYQDEYDAAVTAQEAERWQNHANGKGASASQATSTRVARALNNWLGDGQRRQVEAALGTITRYAGGEPETWWYGLSAELRNAAFMDTTLVSSFPAMDQWTGEDGWMAFSFKASARAGDTVSPMDLKAAGMLKFAGFKGTPGGRAAQQLDALGSDSSLEITMQIKKVIINRPWLNWQVFTNDHWTWDRGVVSDGKGGGLLPLVTNGFIIARNVKFKAKTITGFKQDFLKEIRGDAQASYGPFTLKPGDRKGRQTSVAKEAQNEILIPDPQIIAYLCSVVPRCPAKTVK